MGYVTDHAPLAADLSRCVQCGLCLPYCPTFRLTKRESASPRGRIAAMSAVLEGMAPVDEAFDEALSFCLGCRACEAACPSLVPYGRLFEGARAELAAQRPTPSRRLRRMALGRALEWRRFIALSTRLATIAQRTGLAQVLPGPARRGLAGLRPLRQAKSSVGRTVEPSGVPTGTVALLAGCVMDAWFGPVHEATIGVLTTAGFRVTVPEGQTCCGALAAHDGSTSDARRMAGRNVEAFADVDLIVSDSAGCTAHLKEYGHWHAGGDSLASRTRDVTELVASLLAEGILPRLATRGEEVAMQDPCHLRHAQRIVAAPREIVRAAGLTPIEIDPDGLCCGAAGVYSVLRPDTSDELGRRKADQVRGTAVHLVASANPGCEMQLRSHLGTGYRIAHPVELYWEALRASQL
ncbi:MAG: (Fe-S)-binding protein [Acidimicrobiia bacterium]|nr:(Fe-S)-binding protein [Acidimicrobiia bacterium]